MDKHLHIVSFDVPWPANYGGVIDVFNKIVSLHQAGCRIHLHCFTSHRTEQTALTKYCESVHYYKRKQTSALSLTIPYIVKSRSSKELITRLGQDSYPILLEGIHCTWLLHTGALKGRNVFIRLHNVENEYYQRLAVLEKNILVKNYFVRESRLLKKYEKEIAGKAKVLALSTSDAAYYTDRLNAKVEFIPAFIPWHEVTSATGTGSYSLYHGNLAVNENSKAAAWLSKEIFTGEVPLIIAGNGPDASLQSDIQRYKNVTLVANPTEIELQRLIQNAQLHVLPSFNSTGVKLKLLNALYNGRHCLVNAAAIQGSGLDGLCSVATGEKEFKNALEKLMKVPFTEIDKEKRKEILESIYDNEANAQKIMTWL